MATGPQAGDEWRDFLDEIRAVVREELREELGQHGEGQAPAGGQPGPDAKNARQVFRGEVRGLVDRELPIERKDLRPLRGEFQRVISRLWPPRSVDNEALRAKLESAGDRLITEEEDAKVRERWRQELERLLPKTGQVEKAIVAVHGIGDQYSYGTIQQTVQAFCRYMGVPAAFPLGRFHGRLSSVFHALVPKSPPDPEWKEGQGGTPADPKSWPLAFAEIYWANIPRQVVKEGYTLEEAKTWALTLVERLRLKAEQKSLGAARDRVSLRAYEQFGEVIEEMITSVRVAERLFRIVRYAGLGDFQLKKILDDYINDVQVVGEFYSLRRELLDVFTDVMRQVSRSCPGADIYIVAHSEGTVVSFLGLLEGIANSEPWVENVKGLMTIGSPLNKHVLIWREIFDEYKVPPDAPVDKIKITWHNYAESGDPIGYNLGITYDWMEKKSGQHWERFFDFDPKENDHSYAHSPWPGDAHNNYWKDDKVFGHFISNVVDTEKCPIPSRRHGKWPRPSGEWDKWVVSYFLPYVFSTLILLVGTFLLYKSARAVMDPVNAPHEDPLSLFRNVLALTALVAGTTGLATLPRLFKPLPGVPLSWIVFAIGAVLYCWGFEPEHLRAIAKGWMPLFGIPSRDGPLLSWGRGIAVTLAFAAGFAAGLIRWIRPSWGLLPMILLGAPAVGLAVVPRIITQAMERRAEENQAAFDLQLISWGDGQRVPNSGRDQVIVGTDNNERLHVRVFDRDGNRVTYTDETSLPPARAEAMMALKRRVPGLLPPRVPSDDEWKQVRSEVKLIVGQTPSENPPYWPILLSSLAFLYLWWLATLLFDMTVIWHVYVRWQQSQNYMAQIAGEGEVPARLAEGKA